MNGRDTTEHEHRTGRFTEAWGRAHDDEGIEVEGQLQQVAATARPADREDFDDLEESVRERSGEDVDPEGTSTA